MAKRRKGFEAITMVLLVLIAITAVYIVAYHFFPNMRLLVIAATSKMAGQLQLAVRQCQAFHEELNFLENMVDQVGVRQSMSEAGLNGGSGPINCCSKGSPGCASSDSSPTECIKKCAALLKLHEECSKYPTPGVDCYKDAATRGEVEAGVEAAVTPTPTGGTPTPTPTGGTPTPTPTGGTSCTDTDAGDVGKIKGTCTPATGKYCADSSIAGASCTDYCIGGSSVREYFCTSGTGAGCGYSDISCPSGYACSNNGACVSVTPTPMTT